MKSLLEEPLVIAFRRCRNLCDLIGENKLVNNKCLKPKAKHTIKKCEPCRIKEGSLCCKQMLDTNQFSSHVTGKSYKIYHQLNCKSSNTIYLMDCSKCHKQCVGKAQTAFNLRLNNHHKDVRRTDAIRADRRFNCPNHDFNRDTKFTVIEELKGELQRENKLISYERAFKMLENDMYIAGIGQAVLELLSFKVESGNHQRGISLLQKISDIFGNMRLVPLKMTSHLTSHNFKNIKN